MYQTNICIHFSLWQPPSWCLLECEVAVKCIVFHQAEEIGMVTKKIAHLNFMVHGNLRFEFQDNLWYKKYSRWKFWMRWWLCRIQSKLMGLEESSLRLKSIIKCRTHWQVFFLIKSNYRTSWTDHEQNLN